MLIPFDNQAMWMCDFCLRAEPEMAHVSRHTHAVICASCIKNPVGLYRTKEKSGPAAAASEAAQSGASEQWPNPRISRKGFMNPSSTYHPCHLCGELEHTHEMRVNIQNGAALCARCVLEHFEPWRDTSEAERP